MLQGPQVLLLGLLRALLAFQVSQNPNVLRVSVSASRDEQGVSQGLRVALLLQEQELRVQQVLRLRVPRVQLVPQEQGLRASLLRVQERELQALLLLELRLRVRGLVLAV